MSKRRRIDVHTHYLPTALVSALERRHERPRISRNGDGRTIEYGEGSGHRLLPSMIDLGVQFRDMDEHEIDLAIVSVNIPGVDWFPSTDGIAVARDVNDELVDLTRVNAGRLAALAVLPMQSPEAAAAELERAVGAGLKGGVVFSNVAGSDIEAANCGAVFEAAAQLDVPIMIHPTYPLSAPATDAYALIPTVGFLVDSTIATLRLILGGLFVRHPDLRLYLCHAGSLLPQLAGRIDYEGSRLPGGTGKLEAPPSEELAKLYTDTVCASPVALRSALELVGPERLMFGSDYPFWNARTSIDTVAETGLERESLGAVEAGNAVHLFRLGD